MDEEERKRKMREVRMQGWREEAWKGVKIKEHKRK